MKEQFLTQEFCRVLSEKIGDPFIQVRFNAISAIINLIICYSENDIDNIFLFEVGLLKRLEELLLEYYLNIRNNFHYSEGEQTKINKLIKSTIDLILLILELYDSDDNKNYNKLDFNNLIKLNVEFILNPGFLSEEVIINSCLFLSNILSLKVFSIEDNEVNNLKNFSEFAYKIVSDKNTSSKANPLVVSSFTISLFYIYCNNFTQINNPEFIKFLMDSIYTGINFKLADELDVLNLQIQNYIKNCSHEENQMMIEGSDKEKEIGKSNSSLKEKMKSTEFNIRSTLLYLKTFTDVINSVELKNNPSNNITNDVEPEEEEEIFDDENESNEKIEDEIEIEKNISFAVNNIFKEMNYEPLYIMLKNDFLPNLINFFDNLTIEEFLLNDFDKMIVIRELLYDLEYFTLSLINNTLQNYEGLFNDNLNLVSKIAITINKRLQFAEYSKNQDFLSVLLTCLRTILEKFKKLNDQLETKIDYKTLFVILNNNLSDSFIKINIVDIISFLFSNCQILLKEENLEICKLLYNLCINENDMEVISHALNAYFDIYKEDDYDSNLILKQVGVVELMKMGVTEFKTRIKNAYKTKELDKMGYEYSKETLLNLKRFIKYKEKLFNQLNI